MGKQEFTQRRGLFRKIQDGTLTNGKTEIGHVDLPISEILRGEEQNGGWWPLSGSPAGRLRIEVELKALSGVDGDVVEL